MKFSVLLLLCLCLCVAVGCTPKQEITPTEVSSTVTPTQTETKEIKLNIAYDRYWTWNNLYDYLESPLQSGNLAFDANTQTLRLFANDGITKISDWSAPLQDGMIAQLYDLQENVIQRFLVNITNAPQVVSQPESKQEVPSVVSIPAESQVSSDTTSSTVPKQKVAITLRGKDNKALKKAVDAFNKQSQTVTVTLTDGNESVLAAGLLQEGNTTLCPDVVLMDYSQYTIAAEKGLLTSFSEADQEPFGLEVSGPVHGILLGKEASCIAANDDVLCHCDVELPETYDQMIEVAGQVKETFPKTIPLGIITSEKEPATVGIAFEDLLTAKGGRLLTPDHEAVAFYSQNGIETMEAYNTLNQQGLITKNYGSADYNKGNTAFGRVSSKQYEQIFGNQARHNFTPLPLLLPGEAGGMVQSYYYCVPKNDNKEKTAAAYDFLSYLLGDETTVTALCKTAGLVPANQQARQDKYYQTDAWQIFMDEADRGYNPPALDCMDTLYGYLTEGIQAVLDGENPDAALAHARDLTEQRLARK
ncbi:MAG: extracellular solute-binding protein [Clostridia bacterium]|nr:extracellular solute-binding protein [Clostridia bacterium]